MSTENNDSLFEATAHSFIVRMWVEETVEEAGRTMWRGHITHVPTGERRYLRNLGDITLFIIPYLQGMGIQIKRRWQLLRLFSRRDRDQPPARGG
jgi:hypothetical protein